MIDDGLVAHPSGEGHVVYSGLVETLVLKELFRMFQNLLAGLGLFFVS